MRLALALLGLICLCACNVVLTKTPLFAAQDAAGAPTLRPGVWVFAHEAGCKFDERQPFLDWPNCAGGGLVGLNDIAGQKQNAAKGVLEHTPVILASGDPRVLQLQISIDVSAGASASASGDATAAASASATGPQAMPWGYGAVRPTLHDDQGRITAFSFWPILCGPPPPKKGKDDLGLSGTEHPLPGLTMQDNNTDCTTDSKDALRGAARASEAWADKPLAQAHWVRDGDR